MSTTIDARGLSCPQPVLLTLDEIKKGSGIEFTVLVDTDTAKENVSRAAQNQGCTVTGVAPDGDGYQISITRG